MHKHVLIATLVFAAAYASPEPPSPFLDEPLEGQRLEPELLSRVRDLLVSDTVGAPVGGPSPQSASPSSYSSPSANSYGPPSKAGGFDGGMRGFGSAPPNGNFGSFGGSNSNSRGTAPEVTISDPELAPLLDAFDLSPTTQKRTGAQPSGLGGSGNQGFNGNTAGPSGSRFGSRGPGGY